MKTIIFLCSLLLVLAQACSPALAAPKKSAPTTVLSSPRLIVAIAIDQFRADQMLRWRDRFGKGGFRRLFEQAAVYPFAQYPVLQNMTCSGHAMILSGSVPAMNGIPMNTWFDPQAKRPIYCTDDGDLGPSPRRLQGSTLGDQMKLQWPNAKVVTVALKDRSAIMLGGRGADAAYWYNDDKLTWESSRYYKNQLKSVTDFVPAGTLAKGAAFEWRAQLGSRPFNRKFTWGTGEGFTHPLFEDLTRQMAVRAIEAHGLGQDEVPDLLGVSFSSHDFAGHFYSPDSPEVEEITLQEDRILATFFEDLDKKVPGGLKNVWIMLTADHGGAPNVEIAQGLGLDAGRIDAVENMKTLNQQIKERFSSCKNGDWLVGTRSFHFYWDPECLAGARFRNRDVEKFARDQMATWPGVATVFTRGDYDAGRWPPAFEQELKKSYVPGISGDLVIIPKPFWYELDKAPNTHMTSYVYDRTVPLVLWGSPFRPGVYSQRAEVIDGVPTLAHALRILAPAASSGRVLSESLAPEKL